MAKYVRFPDDESDGSAALGGKAGALARLGDSGLPIPAWFAVTPDAFFASLTPAQKTALDGAHAPEDIAAIVENVAPGADVRAELDEALHRLRPSGGMVAVRSSALDEDGARQSFAGQLDSFLFVRPGDVAVKIAAVWRSGYGERLLAYRIQNGLPPVPSPPAVLIQTMIDADAAGVAFGADPVSGRRSVCVVAAVPGLGTALVSGEADADVYHFDRSRTLFAQAVAQKTQAHRAAPDSPEGVAAVPLPPESQNAAAITDDQARGVLELLWSAERVFERPQDIEWAIKDDRLFLLQSRPITTLGSLPDPDGALNLWDNSNIVESYAGISSPLTFSFALRAYEEVYRQFCRLMRVPEDTISAHDTTFRHMLGLIRGRVYYNLLNWYRLLALLPGYQANAEFMERMMGVKEGLPPEIQAELTQATRRERRRDKARFLVTVFGLIESFFALPRSIATFYARLNDVLTPLPGGGFEHARADELAAHYRSLERSLLARWDAPLVNDFFAMIFYGALRGMCVKWCGDEDGTLQNDLISGEGGMVSAEPAQRVREMAAVLSFDPGLAALFCSGTPSQVKSGLAAKPDIRRLYDAYLEKFGDRCLEELKLESATLRDDPATLLRAVGRLALAPPPAQAARAEATPRARAEARVEDVLKNPLRRVVFDWTLANARARVRDRENLRFERTRVFGRVRRIFVELGRRFHALGALDSPRDVFHLTVEEVLGFVEGVAVCTDLAGLAAVRKAEYARHLTETPPGDRFETRGAVHQGNGFSGRAEAGTDTGDELAGIGCCPGIVRGRVRVVRDPRAAQLEPGMILVAERTDPGWILLFPSASGLLVERGSLLSHSAIVAREMGIPAIVSIPGLMNRLTDGECVEMNGSTGIVKKDVSHAE